MEQIAFEIGIKLNELYGLTPRQFANALYGYQVRVVTAQRESYEQTRMIMFAAQAPYADKNFKPTDIIVFPWEEHKKEIKPWKPTKSKAELEAIFEKIDQQNGISHN